MGYKTMRNDIRKNFYSVHCSIEDTNIEEADEDCDYDYVIKENIEGSNRKIQAGFGKLGNSKSVEKETKTVPPKSLFGNLVNSSKKAPPKPPAGKENQNSIKKTPKKLPTGKEDQDSTKKLPQNKGSPKKIPQNRPTIQDSPKKTPQTQPKNN